jgi:hypothetical protein
VGEITGSNSGSSLWTNPELALEENVLSKWREQGVLYIESTGSIIHSRKRCEINITKNHIHKERSTIHPTITTRIFSSTYRTFALNSGQNSDYIQ